MTMLLFFNIFAIFTYVLNTILYPKGPSFLVVFAIYKYRLIKMEKTHHLSKIINECVFFR